MRRATGILSVALITAGIVVLADAAVTLAWKEPLSSLYSSIRQQQAAEQLDELERRFATSSPAVAGDDVAGLARRFSREVRDGEGIGTIEVPSIDVDYVVVEGTSTSALERGPGRYEDRAFPGQGGTVGIAGHRTTYGAPFHRIDELERGDRIALEMPYGSFEYRVTRTEIVEPTDVEIVDDVGRERLVLTACHPLYSAAERYAVFARPPPADRR